MRDDTNRPCQSRFDQWSENQLSIATAVGAKLEASSNSQPSLQDCFQCNDIRNLIAWLRDLTWQLADAIDQSSQCRLGPERRETKTPGDFSKRGVPFHALVDDRLGKVALPGPEQEAGRSDRLQSRNRFRNQNLPPHPASGD